MKQYEDFLTHDRLYTLTPSMCNFKMKYIDFANCSETFKVNIFGKVYLKYFEINL